MLNIVELHQSPPDKYQRRFLSPALPVTSDQPKRSGGLEWESFRSFGPGGQNVNTVSTTVRLRFDTTNSPLLQTLSCHYLWHRPDAKDTCTWLQLFVIKR